MMRWCVLVAVVACGPTLPGEDLEPEAERCAIDEPIDGTPREVVIGSGQGAGFVPYADGLGVPIVHGPQGGYMITPTLRVPALADTEACAVVHIDHGGVAEGFLPGHKANLLFTQSGDHLYTGNIYDLLAVDAAMLVGTTLTLHVTVSGLIAGEEHVTITLQE